MDIYCKKCNAVISPNDNDSFMPHGEEEKESLCGDCNMDFGMCPVCNKQLWLNDVEDERVVNARRGKPGTYVHWGCYQWLNNLARKGECDKCHSQNIELVGWNCYGKLCMGCAATFAILPLSSWSAPKQTEEIIHD